MGDMMTQEQLTDLVKKLRKIVPVKSKIKYDPIERYWNVKYEESEFVVNDAYRYTANRGFVRYSTIKTEI
jgi:hypothetical protein